MIRPVALFLPSICLIAGIFTANGQLTSENCPPPPTETYINFGNATNVQVDASNFVNWGDFWVSTFELPWEAQNVQRWENRGVMAGSLGFRFNYTTCIGEPLPAQRFENSGNGSIEAFDGGGFILFDEETGSGFGLFETDVSYVFVDALEVINRGDISVGAAGLIQLHGETVDLTGGTLIVNPLGSSPFEGLGGGFVTSSNFFPDAGLYDLAWAIDTTTNFNFNNIIVNLDPLWMQSPIFRITNETVWCNEFLSLPDAQSWVFMTNTTPTNLIFHVVAVQTSDTNIMTDVRWIPFTLPNGDPAAGGFSSALVEFESPATNVITLESFTNRLYLLDQLATSTNQTLTVNLAAGTLRPAPYILSRFAPFFGDFGYETNLALTPDIFDSPLYSNRIATNIYAAYAGRVDYLTTRLPNISDVGYTNRPGRVEVSADQLTLTAARIRGEGLVSIQASNFIDSASAIVDVPHLDYDLGTSREVLRVRDLAREQVQRFSGDLVAYSSFWTNTMADPSTTNGYIEVKFHLLMVDATDLRTIEPVITHDLGLSAPAGGDVIIDDNLTVSDRLVVDSERLTLNGRLTLQQGLSWDPGSFARLRNLTNNGILQLTEVAQFQRTGGASLDNFVNTGTIYSFSHLINADYFENSGQIVSTQFFTFQSTNICFGTVLDFTNSLPSIGPISIQAAAAKLDGGSFDTEGDIRLMGGVYKINNHDAYAGGSLFLDVNDTLTDNGAGSGNLFQVLNGFHMGTRAEGDLLGTEIQSYAERFGIVDHSWASADVGATAAGFSNNVALGHLVLSGDIFSQFRFMPGQPGSALYVDLLEVDGEQAISIRNLTNTVRLLGMNIYYGAVESTNAALNAERLNGLQLGNGRLIWVTDYAGPRSGVDVPLGPTGPSTRMNRALRESAIIDSDGDGIPNQFDDFPLSEDLDFHLTEVSAPSGASAITFSFGSKPNSRYVIEYTTDLGSRKWQPVGEPVESGLSGGKLTITDELTAGDPQRYYRARLVE